MGEILWFNIITCPECLTLEDWANYSKRWCWERKAETNDEIDGSFKSYLKKASIYPEFSKVIAFAYKYGTDEEVYTIDLTVKEWEKELLKKVNEVFKTHECRIGGFNIYGFTIPFLWKRMIINGVNPHNRLNITWIKPRDMDAYMVDVMNVWKQTSFTCSLDLLSLSLLGEKADLDGIWEYVASAVNSGSWDWVKYYASEWAIFAERCHDAIMYPEQRNEVDKTLEDKKEEAKEIAEKKMEEEGKEVAKENVELPF